MQGKHVVFLDQYGSLGGGQQVLLELVRATLSLGHDATVLLPAGPCADKLRALGATVAPISSLSFTQGQKTVYDILKLLIWNIGIFLLHAHLLARCDIVYVNGLRLLPVAMLAQRLLRRKAACHVHLNHGHKELALIRRFLKHPLTQTVIVPSPFIQRQLVEFDVAFKDERVRLVENGLDARFANAIFEDRFTDKKLQHVAIVGRVSPEKGQDVLPELARQFPELTFHVLGDAAFSEKGFAKLVNDACPGNVIWHGWVEDLPSKISELDLQVILVPSRHGASGKDFESFSLVTFEMTALSCLVVVRHSGALADVANELRLRSFFNDNEITSILQQLQHTPAEQLAQQVKNSYQIVSNKFSNAMFHQRLINLLNAI